MTDGKDLTVVQNSTDRTPVRVPASVEYYSNGGLATVRRETENRTCEKCGGEFREMVGSKYIVCMGCRPITATCEKCGCQTMVTRKTRKDAKCPACGHSLAAAGTRRAITKFSPAARRSLMRKVAKTDERHRPSFLTLTFPDQLEYSDPQYAKVILKRFEIRFRRTFGRQASYFWRVEVVKRKSGRYVGTPFPHFHILCYGLKSAVLFRFVLENWRYCVGTDILPVFHVRTVQSRNGVMAYTAKVIGKSGNMPGEMGKDVQTENAGRVGRWYGQILRENFKRFMSSTASVDLTDRQAINILRVFRKKSKIFGRNYRSLTVFMRGQWLRDAVPKLKDVEFYRHDVRLPLPWHFRATGRDISTPFQVWAYNTGIFVPQLEAATV